MTLAGSRVSAWADQSGRGNHATVALDAGLVAPTVGTTSAGLVVQFDPSTAGLRIPDSTSLQFAGDFALELVAGSASGGGFLYAKVPAGAPNGMEVELMPGAPPYLFVNNPYVLSSAMTAGAANLLDGHLHVLGIRRTGTTCELALDGTAFPSTACGVLATPPGAPVTIGRSYDDFLGSTEDIAEIVALNGAFSAADVANLEAYFRTSYGL